MGAYIPGHGLVSQGGGWDTEKKQIIDSIAERYGLKRGELLYRPQTKNSFHIGESAKAESIECRLCYRDKFYVADGEYYTAIKCCHCGWEICIHEG